MVCFYKDFAVFILNGLAGESSCDTLLQAFDLFLAVCKCFYIHTRNFFAFAAVHLTDDQIL